MSDEVFDHILADYIIPYKDINSYSPPTFIGHKDGEPLLNKQFPRRLQQLAAVAPDMKIDIYSHGLMLPKLWENGKDFFNFVGGLPNKVRYMMSYHPFNHDYTENDYTGVVRYLKNIVFPNRPPNVEFITVSHKSKWVSDELQNAWAAIWTEYPITVHKNCSINPWTGRMEDIATCAYNGCPYSDFGHWFFGVTGNIIACCLDLEEEIVLGNVLTHTPDEMFKTTHNFYAEQRRLHEAQSLHPLGVCRNCFGQSRDLQELGVSKCL